jgi:exonuclease V gamma subunit
LNHLDRYKIGSDIFEKGIQNKKLNIDYNRYRAEGILSFGIKGQVDLDEISAQVAPVFEKALAEMTQNIQDPQNIDIELNGINLTGVIDNIREDYSRLVLTFGKLNPQRLLKEWIYHLALNTFLKGDNSSQTILVGKNNNQSKEISQKIIFPKLHYKESEQLLSDLLDFYKSGSSQLFVFFPETSFEFVKNFLKSEKDNSKKNIFSIMQKCKTKWYSPFSNTGEKVNRYTDLYFGEQDLFQDIDYFMGTGFIENSVQVFQPLMELMR